MTTPPATRKRRRPDLRKLMFVLPNLFTVSSIFCGFYAIVAATGPDTGEQFFRASLAIFFGNLFDTFDGRVARLTRTQSAFGVELDSLADVITFGVAPAVLVYKWALSDLGTPGLVIACVYTACGAIRLARFNVNTHAEHVLAPSGVSRFFVGVPIPLAAGAIVALVLAMHGRLSPHALGLWPIGVLVLGLAFLMVSTIRYRTFKDAGLGVMTVAFVLVVGLAVLFAIKGRLAQVLVVYFGVYILLGLVEQVFFGKKRRTMAVGAAAAGAGAAGAVPPGAEPEEALMPAEEDEDDTPALPTDTDEDDED